jgi:isoleucyl-tRNA synthetase
MCDLTHSFAPTRCSGFDGYDFDVPLLDGDHVTDDAGTGFVHTAPGHGREDFEIWMDYGRETRRARHRRRAIPFTVGADGKLHVMKPRASPACRSSRRRVKKGKANQKVIEALVAARRPYGARAAQTYQYPHSWRSKKPVIFRNTPQWFVYMDQGAARSKASPLAGEVARRAGGGLAPT